MSQIVQALFPTPDYRRTTLSLLQWWESRRLVYNGIVGGTGLITAGFVELFALLPPTDLRHFGVPLPGILIWGIAANVCYTLGWVVEASMERVWKREAPLIGPVLFRQGVAFSVGLTLLPIAIAALGWLGRAFQALF
ncbi:MAG TPA: hypothetical protein VF832_10825 [Longimicrobiales bacterium]